MNSKQKTKTSKFISLILRHDPDVINLKLDECGWANVGELLAGLNAAGHSISMPDLEDIVAADEKKRYTFDETKQRLRAVQGHSIPILLKLDPVEPPEVLHHGTSDRFESNIRSEGIKKMTRMYVHLSQTTETATTVGKRHGGKTVILNIDAKGMFDKGHVFLRAENGVWLTEYVPPEYIR